MVDVRQFLRSKQVVLQTALWLVFGATLGLAALVDHSLRRGLYLALTDPITDGPVSFSLPAQWRLSSHGDGGDVNSHVAIDPNGANDGNRVITVTRQRVDSWLTPLEYLHLSGQFAGKLADMPSETLLVDDWPGQWIAWTSRQSAAGEMGASNGFFFALMLPSREAICVSLQRTGALEPRDSRLFKQILDNLHVSLRPGFGPIILADGTRINVPPEFVVYEQTDPLREDRTIVLRQAKSGWISVQFVGLLTTPQPGADLRTALAAHEGFDFRDPFETERWLVARVDQESATRWRIDPQDPTDHLIHRRAYILGGPKNTGLAIILTAITPSGDDELDSVWSQLSDKIQFGDGVDLSPLLDAGAKTIADAGNASSLQAPASPWWLWTVGGSPQGWSRNGLSRESGLPSRQTVRKNWEGTFTRIQEIWNFDENPTGSSAHTLRLDAEADPSSQFGGTFEQAIGVSGTLLERINLGGTQLPATEMETPHAFVLSGQFPRFLPRLPDNPLAVWTDRFPGLEDQLLASPLLLAIRPANSTEPGLRCLEVRVNGTGWVSRWYFRADHTLDHATFAGDQSLRPATQGEIESMLAGDPHLTVRQP